MDCGKVADWAGADSSGRGPKALNRPRAGTLTDSAPKGARKSRRRKNPRPTSSDPVQTSLRARSGQALKRDGRSTKTTVRHCQFAGLYWFFFMGHLLLIRDRNPVVHRDSEAARQSPALRTGVAKVPWTRLSDSSRRGETWRQRGQCTAGVAGPKASLWGGSEPVRRAAGQHQRQQQHQARRTCRMAQRRQQRPAEHNGKRLSDAPPKLSRRTVAGGGG